jgi:hypothetical protein
MGNMVAQPAAAAEEQAAPADPATQQQILDDYLRFIRDQLVRIRTDIDNKQELFSTFANARVQQTAGNFGIPRENVRHAIINVSRMLYNLPMGRRQTRRPPPASSTMETRPNSEMYRSDPQPGNSIKL